MSNFSCEPVSRLSNLEVDVYDPTFKSSWSRYHSVKELGNLFNVTFEIVLILEIEIVLYYAVKIFVV